MSHATFDNLTREQQTDIEISYLNDRQNYDEYVDTCISEPLSEEDYMSVMLFDQP